MQGLPKDVNLDPLIGAQLEQVCVGENDYILHFDQGVRISVESESVHERPDVDSVLISDNRTSAGTLCLLLGTKIVSANVREDGGLKIGFSDSSSLDILNDSRVYESFAIQIGRNLLVG